MDTKTATTIAQMLVRLTGVILIILGIIFWTGNADALVPLHMLIGFVLVFALWTLAALAARAGVNVTLVSAAVLLGVIAPLLGLTQTRLLTGNAHWVIQVLHLLVGLGAIALGESLAARIKRVPAAGARAAVMGGR